MKLNSGFKIKRAEVQILERRVNMVSRLRTQDVSRNILVVIILSQLLVFCELQAFNCVSAAAQSGSTAFAFASFLADYGDILKVEDAVFNASQLSYDINNHAFLTGRDLEDNRCGRVLYKSPIRMVSNSRSSTSIAASFNTSFTFAFLKTNFTELTACGSGMVFTFATHQDFTPAEKSRRGKGICTFNPADRDASNRVFAVKFDSSKSDEFLDPSDANIGVVISNKGATNVVQYNLCGPNVTNCKLFCGDKGNFTAWVDYDGPGDVLEVRFRNGSLNFIKPMEPVIRVSNLSLNEVLDEEMYVGFTASTFNAELHRIRSWSFNSSGLPNPENSNALQPGALVGIISAALILGAGLLLGLILVLKLRRKQRNYFDKLEQKGPGNLALTDTPHAFTYRELRKITKNFSVSERLSSGAFGDVFKGTLPSGSLVAVKRIKGNREQGEESFIAEATSLRQIRHRNLLQLRGWCYADEGLLLVYDYMCNGSLNKWLHRNPRMANGLSWSVRRFILAGVASGLKYLHEEWVQCVLHRDIKSSNVLLDADFNAYLGDFGLARLVDHHKLERTTLLAGTLGYMAPEMQYTGRATKETDVYAFGILILEVVCERRPLATQAVEPGEYVLLDRVWHAHEAGNILKVADTRLSEEFSEMRTLQPPTFEEKMVMAKFLHVGLLCCLPNPSERPSMRVVNQWFQASEVGAAMELPPLPITKPYVQYSASHSSQGSASSKSSNVSGTTFQTWGFSEGSSVL